MNGQFLSKNSPKWHNFLSNTWDDCDEPEYELSVAKCKYCPQKLFENTKDSTIFYQHEEPNPNSS